MSCACHWAVNQAAGDAAGRMWGNCYAVLPSGVYVAPDSTITRPEDLAGVEIAVGYHSGSHFSTLQALEADYYLREIPERFHDLIDVRRFGPGERIVFLPYTSESYERTQQWLRERHLFEDTGTPPGMSRSSRCERPGAPRGAPACW